MQSSLVGFCFHNVALPEKLYCAAKRSVPPPLPVVNHLWSPKEMDPTENQKGPEPKERPRETFGKQAGPNSISEPSTDSQPRLVEILAEMLRSALVWEEKQGVPPSNGLS